MSYPYRPLRFKIVGAPSATQSPGPHGSTRWPSPYPRHAPQPQHAQMMRMLQEDGTDATVNPPAAVPWHQNPMMWLAIGVPAAFALFILLRNR